jgi:crotonobetainyl-CoA:carnitine CoA-transferase CaiB-like acyl-CoA transferase
LIYTNKHWGNFFQIIGKPQIFDEDSRFSSHGERIRNIDAVYDYLASVLATCSTADWLDAFTAADIPAARMNSLQDILSDEHLAAIGYVHIMEHPSEGAILEISVPTEWSDVQPSPSCHAPRLGEHT